MKAATCFFLVLIISVLQFADSSARKKKGHRIIEGRPASIEEFPYQVTLERNGRHFCGGSILHERIILTAAHCTPHLTSYHDVDPKQMIVRVGTSLSGEGGILHRVKFVQPHEGYNDGARVDTRDIALILLLIPIEMNARAQKIKLSRIPPTTGGKGWITGFGSQLQTNSRSSNGANQLMAVEIPVVSTTSCKSKLGGLGGTVADDMFCAGYETGHRDACRGDSGGPFQMNGVLYGAVAWGIGCGIEGLPGVYSDLHLYKDWLQSTSTNLLQMP